MKKWIFTLTAFTCGLYASNISENLSYQDKLHNTPPNIGHFTFSIGGVATNCDYKTALPTVNFGYQSKIMNASIFHSASIEWSLKAPFLAKIIKHKEVAESFSRTQIMGIHYFQKEAGTRYFISTGASTVSYIHTQKQPPKHVNIYIGPSIATGVETGNPSGTINIFKICYDFPLIPLISDGVSKQASSVSVSFGVGF